MSTNVPLFPTGRDVHTLFRSSRQDIPVDLVKALRSQLSLKSGENSVSVQDARLILAKEWLELSPGAQDVFGILEKQPQPTVEGLCLSILSSLLTLTSQHLVYQHLGQTVVKTLLTPRWLRKLNVHLSGGQSELCLATLKILNSLSDFAGGKEQKNLLECFAWDVKIFQKLLYMRRKGMGSGYDALAKPDIRVLCLQFILSFVSLSSHIKSSFLEQHRDIFLSIFKGVNADEYSVLQYVLETLWTKIWQDQKIRRTLKVGLFGEKTIQHLLRVYERSDIEGGDPEAIPANIVHHFLLAICTHRGIGICFVDNGWYPRQENDSEPSSKGEKVYNKILANVLKMLNVSDDARQQELALKILKACPELVAGYLQFLAPTLEPRLSSKWLANAAIFGSIVSLPVPVDTFYLRASGPSSSNSPSAYKPAPPPLSAMVDNIIPSTILKIHLTKTLQSTQPLLQHTAGLLLGQCLRKCESVQDAVRMVRLALEESEAEGQWARRVNEIEREIRRRVPEINVVIAFANAQQSATAPNIKAAMLAELSQRLLWLYHRCLPSLVVEARYDLAKSLRSILGSGDDDKQTSVEIGGLNRLQQLHVLRMLTENDQFTWYAKAGQSGPSNLHILLGLFLKTKHASIRHAISTLLTKALRDTLLFQHDPEELQLWLDSLPTSVRSVHAETPDGARLADERLCVISFLEECMQRCTKTPHRYIDELDTLTTSTSDVQYEPSFSPVLLVVLEQLNAKMRCRALEPSNALALTTFVRKVMVTLLGKQSDARVLSDLTVNLRTAVTSNAPFENFPTIAAALQRECDILDMCLTWCSAPTQLNLQSPVTAPSAAVVDFVAQVEELQYTERQSAVSQAYELVDWIRLVDEPLSPSIISRVASVVQRLHAPALSSFCLHLAPNSGLLWALSDYDLENWVAIDWILLHTNQEVLVNGRFGSLLQAGHRRNRRSLYYYRLLAGLLIHRLREDAISDDVISVCEILALLLESAKGELVSHEFSVLKTFVLSERRNMRRLSCAFHLSYPLTSAIGQLLDLMLDTCSASDRRLVSPMCEYWVSAIVNSLEYASWQDLSGSIIWIKYMSYDDMIVVTGRLLQTLQRRENDPDNTANGVLFRLVESVLSALVDCKNSALPVWLSQNFPALLSLRKILPTTKLLDKIIRRSIDASLPLGCDGLPIVTAGNTLRSAVHGAEVRWTSCLTPLPQDAPLASLLDGADWSTDLSHAIASFIYRSPDARCSFWSWLSSGNLMGKPILKKLAFAIHAFFDSNHDVELIEMAGQPFVGTLFNVMTREFCAGSLEANYAVIYGSCLVKIIQSFPSQRSDFLRQLSVRVSLLPGGSLHLEVLRLAERLISIYGEDANVVLEATLGHALQWCTWHMSETLNSGELNEPSLVAILDAVQLGRNIAPHFAEPVIAAAIHHHVCHAHSIRLAEALLTKVTLKPMNVNRHLQSVLQHPHFARLVASDPASDERKAIARLLYTFFLAHPANTSQPSHVEPLIRLYSGSLSLADQQILAIFRVFEEQRRTSVASILMQWSRSGLSHQQTALDAFLDLDAVRLLRTCLLFPYWRTIPTRIELVSDSSIEDGLLYDPVFLLLLFAQVMDAYPPQSAPSWVSLCRTNIVSLIIRCLSSADLTIRKIALLQLSRLYTMLQTADMHETVHVVYLLDLVRYLLRVPSNQMDGGVSRLPSFTTLFFAHALRCVFYPANFIYPLTARFLLQRPEIDIEDVPMLYSMLYCSGDGWKKERGWIVRFLADGMLSSNDWWILKRRHTWDLLASLFQGSHDDRAFRHLILDVLANLTCQVRATSSLLLRNSLVHWIEIQLLTVRQDETIPWAKIIENILVVADSDQFDQATRGQWQKGLLRGLGHLTTISDIRSLRLISRILLRLSSDVLVHSGSLRHVLDCACACLLAFEISSDMSLPASPIYLAEDSQVLLPPHRSNKLHQPLFERSFETWGRTVENLWNVSLKHGVFGTTWDQLSSRLLLWRALTGERRAPMGEWARRQVLHCLALPHRSAETYTINL